MSLYVQSREHNPYPRHFFLCRMHVRLVMELDPVSTAPFLPYFEEADDQFFYLWSSNIPHSEREYCGETCYDLGERYSFKELTYQNEDSQITLRPIIRDICYEEPHPNFTLHFPPCDAKIEGLPVDPPRGINIDTTYYPQGLTLTGRLSYQPGEFIWSFSTSANEEDAPVDRDLHSYSLTG